MISFENDFKPEVRSAGQAFIKKDKVALQQPSDTEIISYVRGSTNYKVILKTPLVESDTVFASCTCSLFAKGQNCKHLWAALVVAQEKKPDFFEEKALLEHSGPDAISQNSAPEFMGQQARQDAFKERQRDYQKLQYQKQKLRLKQMKLAKENTETEDELFPPPIETALKYFSENGFELRNSMTKENVSQAMKKLSRIFHPDKGGTHEEFTELNKNAEILTKFSVN